MPATSGSASSSSSSARRRSGAPSGSTSPAPIATATSSCSCRPGFARYGEEIVLYRPPDERLPEPWPDDRAARGAGSGRPCRSTRSRCRGSMPPATPQPVQRLEAIRLADWERQGPHWRVPRSSLAPILRFADVEGFVQEAPDGGLGRHRARRVRPDRRRQGGSAPLSEAARPPRTATPPISSISRLGSIAARTEGGSGHRARPGRHRPCPDIRVAGRSATRGGWVRLRSPPSRC